MHCHFGFVDFEGQLRFGEALHSWGRHFAGVVGVDDFHLALEPCLGGGLKVGNFLREGLAQLYFLEEVSLMYG